MSMSEWGTKHKRRVTLFITFFGEPGDDSKLALHVAEALSTRLKTPPAFTPGGGYVDRIDIAVGNTKLAEVDEDFDPVSTSDLKHG